VPHYLIGDVLVDATPSENPVIANEITDKPVEDGATISDHVHNQPTLLTLECTFTGQSGASAEEKYEALLSMAQNKDVIEVAGGLQLYENMVIEEISPVKDVDIANGFRADVILKQVRFVSLDTITIDLGLDPVTDIQAQGEGGEIGRRDPGADDVDQDTLDSMLYRLIYGEDDRE